jgi:tetratricopeptide (TPR) repeat protein
VAGRLNQLGPATDVYSLGATLYCLLTGQPPFQQGPEGDIFHRIQQGGFPPPRQVHKGVPAALEAICLKAMALQPDARYTSAPALAGDVEHWLADEPVTAYPEPASVRLGRWMRRHRTLMSSLGVLLVTAVVGLSVGLVVVGRERALKEEQRQQAVAQKERADEEAAVARAVNEFLRYDLLGQADIGNQTGGERNRNITVRELLDRAAQGIEGRFPGQERTEAAIRLTLGDAYRVLGEYAKAEKHLERSLTLRLQKLGADHPDTLHSMNNLATLYQQRGRYDEAEPLFKQALAGQRVQLGDDHPHTLTSMQNLGVLAHQRGRYDEAEPLCKQVLAGQRLKLGDDHPETLISMHNLAALYQERGR